MTNPPVINLDSTYIVGVHLEGWEKLQNGRKVVAAAVQEYVLPLSEDFILALLDGAQKNTEPSIELLQREADVVRLLIEERGTAHGTPGLGDIADFLEHVRTSFSCKPGRSYYRGPETFFQCSAFRLIDCRAYGFSAVEFSTPRTLPVFSNDVPIDILPPRIYFTFDIDGKTTWSSMTQFASRFGVNLPAKAEELRDLTLVQSHRNRSVTHTAKVSGEITLNLELADSSWLLRT